MNTTATEPRTIHAEDAWRYDDAERQLMQEAGYIFQQGTVNAGLNGHDAKKDAEISSKVQAAIVRMQSDNGRSFIEIVGDGDVTLLTDPDFLSAAAKFQDGHAIKRMPEAIRMQVSRDTILRLLNEGVMPWVVKSTNEAVQADPDVQAAVERREAEIAARLQAIMSRRPVSGDQGNI